MQTLDFSRSYFRFYLDFESRLATSLSHRPPTRTNRTRILLEASCRLTHIPSGSASTTYLSAACKTEQVGAPRGGLWIQPNADVIFLVSDDGECAIHKSWDRCDKGVMRYPANLGPQPERQYLQAGENFDSLDLDLSPVDAEALTDFAAVEAAIASKRPLVSRLAYTDGDWAVVIDQPVKTINIAARDRLHQTDTGPLLVPDFREARDATVAAAGGLRIARFDLAYSAWHAPDWAEVVINEPTPLSAGLRVNHYSRARLLDPCANTLLALP